MVGPRSVDARRASVRGDTRPLRSLPPAARSFDRAPAGTDLSNAYRRAARALRPSPWPRPLRQRLRGSRRRAGARGLVEAEDRRGAFRRSLRLDDRGSDTLRSQQELPPRLTLCALEPVPGAARVNPGPSGSHRARRARRRRPAETLTCRRRPHATARSARPTGSPAQAGSPAHEVPPRGIRASEVAAGRPPRRRPRRRRRTERFESVGFRSTRLPEPASPRNGGLTREAARRPRRHADADREARGARQSWLWDRRRRR